MQWLHFESMLVGQFLPCTTQGLPPCWIQPRGSTWEQSHHVLLLEALRQSPPTCPCLSRPCRAVVDSDWGQSHKDCFQTDLLIMISVSFLICMELLPLSNLNEYILFQHDFTSPPVWYSLHQCSNIAQQSYDPVCVFYETDMTHEN